MEGTIDVGEDVTRMEFRTRTGRSIEIHTDRPCTFCAFSSDGCTPAQACTFSPSDGLLEHLGLTLEEIESPPDRARSAVWSPTKGDVPDPARKPQGADRASLGRT